MTNPPDKSSLDAALAGPEMMTLREVGRFFGGDENPIHKTTLYRWIKDGRLPPPINIGNGTKRWRRSECRKILDAMIKATKPPFKPGEDA